jgi:Ca-activated chloride channel family protein
MLLAALGWAVFGRRWRRPAPAAIGPALAAMLALSPVRRTLRRGLLAVALALCVLAASGPRHPGQGQAEQRGIDVVLAIDYSASMLAADVYPERSAAGIRLVEALLDAGAGNRHGVVVFAGAAAHFPLTHDREAVRAMFRGLQPHDLPPGSNLGEAIRVGRCLVRPGRVADPGCERLGGRGRGGAPLYGSDGGDDRDDYGGYRARPMDSALVERGRALIVITDGDATAGDAARELALAARLGVEVYLVGVGTLAGARVPDHDPGGVRIGWKRAADGQPVISRLNLSALRELAQLAGGEQRLFGLGFAARSPDELPDELARLQRSLLRTLSVRRYRDRYAWFLFPALVLLIIEATMSIRRRRSPRESIR